MMKLLLLLTFLAPFIVSSLDYQSGGNGWNSGSQEPHFKLEPSHYLDFPVTKKDFQSWQTLGTSVILRNRTVIVPEAKDKKGMVYNSQANPLKRDWMVDIEVEIGNWKRSSRGGTGLAIYYLKQIDTASHMDASFGYSNRFEGLGIYLNTLIKSERGSQNEIVNAVQGFQNDGNRVLNVFKEVGHMCYHKYRNLPTGQNQKIRIQYDSPLVTVQLYDIFAETFEFCFSFQANLDFNGYFLLSAGSGVYNPDHVYLHSFKLYDPKTVATNDHFLEARKAKAPRDDIANKVREGVKDLFEKHSQADTNNKNQSRDIKNLVDLIPVQRHHLNHRLDQIYTLMEKDDQVFFEYLRGIPNQKSYGSLQDVFFNFRLKIDNLNKKLDKDMESLRTFDHQLKQVRYTTGNIQKGVQQREVLNPSTKALHKDLTGIDTRLQEIDFLLNDYHKAIETLGDKIKKEAGFAQRLEEQRRKFASEHSEQMRYDMTEIDQVFNEMEIQAINGSGWSVMIINIGMVAVIMFSGMLWFKMQRFEDKNA